jgi:hypothetical protein
MTLIPSERHQPPRPKLAIRRDAVALLAFAALQHPAAAAAKKVFGPPPAMRFEADYSDQLHPMCERHIRVERRVSEASGKANFVAHFSGTDVGPPGIGDVVRLSCEEENIAKYKLREWAFDAKISSEGDLVDAGDGIHNGKFLDLTKDRDWEGIRWKDGNRWIVVSRPTTT